MWVGQWPTFYAPARQLVDKDSQPTQYHGWDQRFYEFIVLTNVGFGEYILFALNLPIGEWR